MSSQCLCKPLELYICLIFRCTVCCMVSTGANQAHWRWSLTRGLILKSLFADLTPRWVQAPLRNRTGWALPQFCLTSDCHDLCVLHRTSALWSSWKRWRTSARMNRLYGEFWRRRMRSIGALISYLEVSLELSRLSNNLTFVDYIHIMPHYTSSSLHFTSIM